MGAKIDTVDLAGKGQAALRALLGAARWGLHARLPQADGGIHRFLVREVQGPRDWSPFRGAKLLQAIFPQFSEDFQAELVRLVRDGGGKGLEFVAGVLRAYGGEAFIQPVAKELIKRLPRSSPLINKVEIALLSTGVVSGEYGMAEAYDRKRSEVLDWLQDPDERVRTFAAKYVNELQSMSESERRRADESIAVRKFEYGEE